MLLHAGGVVDVQGVCKSTVVRGEDGFPSGTLRVSDCHDTVVYALAPLQFASIFACSDCTIVLGAVGRMVGTFAQKPASVCGLCVHISAVQCNMQWCAN
jgi:hypothetical protein